jgi:hypothetical protein
VEPDVNSGPASEGRSETVAVAQESAAQADFSALGGMPDMLVLGVTHGSQEMPGVALRAVDAVLAEGGAVILGLEIWTSEQAALDGYLASSGDVAAREQLFAGEFWRGTEDGRSSRAMFDLFEAVRRRVSAGLAAWVLCFDSYMKGAPDARDELMARTVLAGRAQNPDAKYVLLMGNWHSRSHASASADRALAPMAWHLRQAKASVRCVKLRCSGGGFWCCTDDGRGVHRFGGEGPAEGGGLQLFRDADVDGYDGAFDIGPVGASPQAITEPVNATCPRSGDPVVSTSIAHYRGRLVGFCNTHCRDDFAANVAERPGDRKAFDALIDAVR